MGWMISVGQAGAAKRGNRQPLSMRFDGQGVAVRVEVRNDAGVTADRQSAWQAQRVWQKVLSTVVDFE